MKHYKNKIIVITGAGSGIGRAIAERAARYGGYVVVTDRNGESANAVAVQIQHFGGFAESATLDVVDGEAVQRLITETAKKHGRIDFLFNNAGTVIIGEAKDHTLEDWYTTLDVNLRGVIHGVHAAYPIMRIQGYGHIVNTASIAGLVPSTNEIAYTASKHAVLGLTSTLRIEAAHYGVKVSAICPGFVDTPILFENATNKYSDEMNFGSREAVKKALKVKVMNVEDAASIILRGVSKNQAVILLTFHAKLCSLLNRLSPTLFMQVSKSILKEQRKHYNSWSIGR